MTRYRNIAAALILLAAAGLSSEGQAQCVSRSEGQQMVDQGQVQPLPAALANAGLGNVNVLGADLCRVGGGWVYQVRYNAGGAVKTANVPAG
jgi:hypothetical protein